MNLKPQGLSLDPLPEIPVSFLIYVSMHVYVYGLNKALHLQTPLSVSRPRLSTGL